MGTTVIELQLKKFKNKYQDMKDKERLKNFTAQSRLRKYGKSMQCSIQGWILEHKRGTSEITSEI